MDNFSEIQYVLSDEQKLGSAGSSDQFDQSKSVCVDLALSVSVSLLACLYHLTLPRPPTHARTHTRTRAHTHTYTQTDAHAPASIYAHAQVCKRAQTYNAEARHTNAHTRT